MIVALHTAVEIGCLRGGLERLAEPARAHQGERLLAIFVCVDELAALLRRRGETALGIGQAAGRVADPPIPAAEYAAQGVEVLATGGDLLGELPGPAVEGDEEREGLQGEVVGRAGRRLDVVLERLAGRRDGLGLMTARLPELLGTREGLPGLQLGRREFLADWGRDALWRGRLAGSGCRAWLGRGGTARDQGDDDPRHKRRHRLIESMIHRHGLIPVHGPGCRPCGGPPAPTRTGRPRSRPPRAQRPPAARPSAARPRARPRALPGRRHA